MGRETIDGTEEVIYSSVYCTTVILLPQHPQIPAPLTRCGVWGAGTSAGSVSPPHNTPHLALGGS